MNGDFSLVCWGCIAFAFVFSLLGVAFACWLRRLGVHPLDGVRDFLRRPWGEVLIVVLCAGGFVRYAASKGLLGGFLGLPPPSAQANLATVLDGSDDVGGMFPAYTNAVTNVCATGIKPADTSVFIRAHWPASLSPAPTGVEVYANSILARTGWSAVGTASVSGPGNSRIIELPYSILPDGWEQAMFFTLGLPFDADGDGLTDQFERVVLQTEPDNPDSDEDGLDDGWEYEHGLDPTSEDSDGDGLSDADEVAWVEVEPDAVPWFSLTPLKTVEASHDLDTGLFACELPFDGRISGERVTVALADVNGVVYFGNASTTNGLSSSNSCDDLAYDTWISSVLVAGYWSDLEMRPSLSSRISFGTAVYDGETYFVVQYENMGTYYGSEANSISFQVSVPASTPDVVRVRYGAVVDARDDYDPVSIGAQGGLDGEGRNSPKLVHAYWEAPQPIASGTTLVYRFGSGGDPLLADTDGDGLFDSEETLLGTNPKLWDTDGDGLPDGWEVDHGLDPFSAEGDDGADGDPDLDGLPNSDECTWRSDPHLSDADGDGLDDGVEVGGITAANVLPWLAFDVATDLTASFPSDGEPFAQWTLPAPVAVPGGVVATATLDLNGMVYFNRVGFSGPLYSRGPHDLRDFIVEENSLVVAPYWSYGLFASLDAPDTTRIRAGTATYSGEEFLLIEYENIYYERSSWEEDALSFQIAIPMNRADRAYVRFSDVRGEDMDGNHAVVGFQGLGARRCASWCAWEHGRVEDGIALQFCFGLGSDPALRDTDGDGLDDDVEAAAHTNPARIDTDSDGIPDKWEIDHGLNANAAADAAADPDGDTLSNFDEYLNGSNPGTTVCGGVSAGLDTDGDGVPDGVEVANGSNPNDASDNGAAPPADAFRELAFNIYGDYAAWEMTLEGLGPMDTRMMKISMGAPNAAQNVSRRLRKGNAYRLSMLWLNCDGYTDPYNWYCWQAKIDDLPSSPSYRGYSSERLARNEIVVGSGWIAENADGLLSGHVHMHDPDEDGYGGGNVAKNLKSTLFVYDVAVSVCKPEDDAWSELEASRVLLDTENLRLKIKVTPAIDSLDLCRQALGNSVVVKTSGTRPAGVSVPIDSSATFLKFPSHSEIRISKTRDELKTLGLVPSNDEDGVNEMAWMDMAATPGQTLADSEAFATLGYEDRGTASTLDPSRTLDSVPPNAVPSESYFKAAGREIVTASYGGTTSARRQIMNQADIFYYSGHGNHATGSIQGGFTPTMARSMWNRDLDCAIIAGCAVLDVKNYRFNSLGLLYQWKHRSWKGACPGELWEECGVKYLLGYALKAPLDTDGGSAISSAFTTNIKSGKDIVTSWRDANDNPKGRNACVIDCSKTPHEFWYWNESSGSPVWTKETKGAVSW